jgi:RNA polymerase sigma-70 factor (ECF subfamily)
MATGEFGRQTADRRTLEQLISCIASGDNTAFEWLRQSTGTLLFGIAYQYLRNRADADEVVADVYMRLWQHSERFDPAKGSANAWLTTLCRHSAIDSLRRLRRRSELHDSVEARPEFAQDSSPESIVECWQVEQSLLAAIGRLPIAQREMILLTFRDGLSHRQISSIHAVPLGTVKSHINRSLKRLRHEMRAAGNYCSA